MIDYKARAVLNYLEYHYSLEKLLNLDETAEPFEEENCSVQSLFEIGVRTLVSIHNIPKSKDSIDRRRYAHSIKVTKLNKPVQLVER